MMCECLECSFNNCGNCDFDYISVDECGKCKSCICVDDKEEDNKDA